jgi:hypothetical protein
MPVRLQLISFSSQRSDSRPRRHMLAGTRKFYRPLRQAQMNRTMALSGKDLRCKRAIPCCRGQLQCTGEIQLRMTVITDVVGSPRRQVRKLGSHPKKLTPGLPSIGTGTKHERNS